MAFLASFIQYIIVFMILAVVAALGIFTGRALRLRGTVSKQAAHVDGPKDK